MPSNNSLMMQAKKLGLFDAEWYQSTYRIRFSTEQEAFEDYLRKSTFSDVQPSEGFDGIRYLQHNQDVYTSGVAPLRHYIQTRGDQPSAKVSPKTKWRPLDKLVPNEENFDCKQRYAVVLHVFYEDFIARFHDALVGFPTEFDLFVTVVDSRLKIKCEQKFIQNKLIKKVLVKTVPNRGRNFGPMLVEFGSELLKYDFFLHMHSKKSLYSGKDQLQWADFLIEYLAKDKQVISQALKIMQQQTDLGLFYPTSFWNLPPWVNHWLKNKGLGTHTLSTKYNVHQDREFFAYPVGGMFWARPEALRDLLERTWTYDDFPAEPIPADGTELHVLERLLPFIAKKSNYRQFFYDPASATFSNDETFIFKPYRHENYEDLKQYISVRNIISFDVFDTIVKRDFFEPDLAKFMLAEKAGLGITNEDFVKLRNKTELDLRIERNFSGDVGIYDIYQRLVQDLDTDHSYKVLADLEFFIDFEMLNAKQVMVDIVNQAYLDGKIIQFITDTYYTEHHIELILEKAGINCPYQLFVSSELGMRKDNGTMWTMIAQQLSDQGVKHQYLHVGDNVCSDAQNPGDLGLNTFHILHPMDKWEALNLPEIREKFHTGNLSYVRKWGPVVSEIGSNPFI